MTQIDAPYRLYERPATAFISSFVGKMNRIEGVWRRRRSGARGRGARPAERAGDARGRRGGRAVAAAREDPAGARPGRACSTAQIVDRFFLGSHWLFNVETPVGLISVSVPNQGEEPPGEGAQVSLAWAPASLKVAARRGSGRMSAPARRSQCGPRPCAARQSAPWLLVGPGALLFLGLVVLPLVLTVILSFHAYDHSDRHQERVHARALHRASSRTATISASSGAPCGSPALTTLICALIGAPEAYILSRMRDPWRSVFLLVIIGAAAGLGRGARLRLEHAAGLDRPGEPGAAGCSASARCKLLYTETAIVIALVHVMLPFMVIPVWTSLQKLDPMVEAAALTLGRLALHGAAPGGAAAGLARACSRAA